MKRFLYKIHDWMLEHAPPCNKIVLLISETLDTRLPLSERLKIRFHMTFCHCCTRYNTQVKSLHKAIHQKMEVVDMSSDFTEHLSDERSNHIKSLLHHEMGK